MLIINFTKKNSNLLFILLITVGLPISIFLKEINILLFPFINFYTLEVYRSLIVLFSIFIVFTSNKIKINKTILLLLIINFIFFYNQIFGEQLKFASNFFDFIKGQNYSIDKNQPIEFFLNKNKNLLINFFNIILPLLVLCMVHYKVSEKQYEYWCLKILNIFFYFYIFLLLFILVNKFYLNNPYFLEKDQFFKINPHVISSILSYALLMNFYIWNRLKKNLNYLYKIITSLVLLYITEEYLLIATSLSCISIIYLIKKKFKFILITLFATSILFIILTMSSYEKLGNPSSITSSLYFRVNLINFYLTNIENINYIFGNNIFIKNIYTYPHNYIVDILICSGSVGILFFFIIKYKIFKNILYKKKISLLHLFLIYNFILSFFSGFFFINISLNILIALFFTLKKERD